MTASEKYFLHASYLISLQIAKTKKPYTLGEELIKPCILSAAEQILGPEAARKFDAYHSPTIQFNEMPREDRKAWKACYFEK